MPPFPELKDITPPTAPPFSSPEEIQALVWQVFGGVTILLLLAALWLWWRWRWRRATMPPLPKPALEHLRDRLSALRPEAGAAAPALLGQEVAEAIRSYLQREHGLMARYRTTEELFGTSLGRRRAEAPPPLPFLRPFADVFTRCDGLKFAGSSATQSEATALVDQALAATEAVRQSLAPPLPPVAPAPPAPPPVPPAIPPPALDSASTAATPPPLPQSDAPAAAHPATRRGASPFPPASPRSDAFTHPQTAAFARGADIIPA